jgi:hypothetical protein
MHATLTPTHQAGRPFNDSVRECLLDPVPQQVARLQKVRTHGSTEESSRFHNQSAATQHRHKAGPTSVRAMVKTGIRVICTVDLLHSELDKVV